jgi:hypothetical protein
MRACSLAAKLKNQALRLLMSLLLLLLTALPEGAAGLPRATAEG